MGKKNYGKSVKTRHWFCLDIPSVNIQAYSLETVVAEKFHTMIDRDVLNSRMKDFFDCYQLPTKRDFRQ